MSDDLFTEREQKLMSLAWQCFNEQPKIDFDKLAGLSGYTNKGSASNAWGAIKKKLTAQAERAMGGGSDSVATPVKAAKATPRKRGKKAAAEEDDDDDEETPAKKIKTPRKKKTGKEGAGRATIKGEEDDEDDMA